MEKCHLSFGDRIESVFQRIDVSCSTLSPKTWNEEALEQLTLYVENLLRLARKGVYEDLQAKAEVLLQCVRRSMGKRCADEHHRSIIEALNSLRNSMFGLRSGCSSNNVVTLHPSPAKKHHGPGANITIGLLQSNPRLVTDITHTLELQAYTVVTYTDPILLKADMQARHFDLVLLDLLLPDCPRSSAISVEEFLSNNPIDIPVIMLSDQANLATRLVALRAGIKAFISKPIEEQELLEKVSTTLANRSESRLKVLVVDDDVMLTEYYEIALREEGFMVETLNDPLSILASVEAFNPDVITLDYSMPGCTGLELAEILNGDPRFKDIPLVFMSAAEEAYQRKGVMGIFSDSFLEKPVDITVLSETLNEVSAVLKKSAALKPVDEPVIIQREPAPVQHLQHCEEFLSLLGNKINANNVEDEAGHYLMLVSLDSVDVIKENQGSLALTKIENDIEKYCVSHPLIQGQGCKFGDFSFLLLLNNQDMQDDELFVQSFMASLASHHGKSLDDKAYVRFSIGVERVGNNPSKEVKEVVKRVEAANASAVAAGGNQYHWVVSTESPAALSAPIVNALKAKSFQLTYQSIVKPDSDERIFEVLVRLKGESGELYLPDQFIPLIDEAIDEGTYHLDRWVIENAFKSLENISGRGAAAFSLVIKLSPNLKQIERLLPFIYNLTSNTRLRGVNRIYFSVSERAILTDVSLAQSLIDSLHTAGCGFIVEHCMVKDASIEAVSRLGNVDFVKLDSSIGQAGRNDDATRTRIRKMQSVLTNKADLIVGLVEDAKTFAQYWDMNIRYFQGFFIHRPSDSMHYHSIEDEDLVLER